MPDEKPETPSQKMNRLIRETPARATRAALADSFRRTWNKTQPKENTHE
ncbi:hypothetical protein ACFYVL_39940 [Streptomyces sp. NPDC004111]